MDRILITGAAGFIGHRLAEMLLKQGKTVVGIDNLNPYYSVQLKRDRLAQIQNHPNFQFFEMDLSDRPRMEQLFADTKPDAVVNLAAQAGVRYSLDNPHSYVDSNVVGFLHILEGCRNHQVKHLIFASSSSVYGNNRTKPFSVHHSVDHPISLYAATKKANELMAHSYSHLYGIPVTGLRFFTVYGPWGRPDMATFKFTKAILEGRPIDVYNYGDMRRDFTYIDDIVEGVMRVIEHVPPTQKMPMTDEEAAQVKLSPGTSYAPYRIYNIGNNKPVKLLEFIEALEASLGVKAEKNLLPLQPGDVLETYADIDDLVDAVGFQPKTPIQEGLAKFAAWYCDYYNIPQQKTA